MYDNYPGTLKILVIEAEIFRDTELFGEMDPYVVIQNQKNEKFQTKIDEGAGKKPFWKENFEIQMSCQDEYIYIMIYDKDWLNDDLIT